MASVGGLFGLERGATDRRRPDLADLLTPLRGGVGCERECSRFSPLAVPPLLAMIRFGGISGGGVSKGGELKGGKSLKVVTDLDGGAAGSPAPGRRWGCARRGGEARRPGEGRSATIPSAGSGRVGGLSPGRRLLTRRRWRRCWPSAPPITEGWRDPCFVAGGVTARWSGLGAVRRRARKDRPDGRGAVGGHRRRRGLLWRAFSAP